MIQPTQRTESPFPSASEQYLLRLSETTATANAQHRQPCAFELPTEFTDCAVVGVAAIWENSGDLETVEAEGFDLLQPCMAKICRHQLGATGSEVGIPGFTAKGVGEFHGRLPCLGLGDGF